MTSKDTLTEIQKSIVESGLGPALVTAGAGSGKTRVLIHRIEYLVEFYGISQDNILALTFTNKAAGEIKKRIFELYNEPYIVSGTFHSFCARFLRKNIYKLGMPYTNDFSIYSTSDTQKVIKEIIASNSFTEIEKDDFKKVEWHISNMKNGGETFDYSDEMIRAINAYNEKLKNSNALDFDDLLLKTLEIFDNCPEILTSMQQRFKYILVDEFQDTNIVQYKIVERLAREHKNIMCVGDEDQCIYTWRGASIKNISLFRKDFGDVKIYKLEENFRSSKNIVELANRLVGHNSNRLEKVLFSNRKNGVINLRQCFNERDEAREAAEMIAYSVREGSAKYSDFAVLMRINALSRVFEEQFLAYNIPHIVWGGFKFYDRAEIKSVINYLRVLVNQRDEVALFDIINWPRRGVGDASLGKIKELGNPFDVVMDIEKYSESFTKKTLAGIKNFVHVFRALQEVNDSFGLFELAGSLISVIGLDTLFNTKKEEDLSRLENIYQLEKAIKDFAQDNAGATLGQYLQSVSLVSGDDTGLNDDAVIISTVHSAKGLEFKTVFVAGLEDGLFPLHRAKNSEAEMEEERRLLYVAITRAREKLYLTYCAGRFLQGERKICLPSLFLKQCGFEIRRTGFDSDSERIAPTQPVSPKNEIVAKKDTAQSLGFAVGDRVRHEKFGDGVVADIIDKNIIKIKFDVAGVKMLSLAFATVKKI